jgi:arylformamidase
MPLIDISPIIDVSIKVWPGDTPFGHTVNLDIEKGSNITLSHIQTTVHVGAHADAPNHYLPGGEDIASRRLDYYLGLCNVIGVRVGRGECIYPEDVDLAGITAARVLFRTGTFPDPSRWNDDFASLSPELVHALHARGVILAGIDTPSVDPFDSRDLPAHHALAEHDMALLEGLLLADVRAGEYELIALPLRLRHADASPVRAVLRTL